MRQEDVVAPGPRDVRGTLDRPDDGSRSVVVACPPHPNFGGDRRDRRLRAVAEALVERGVSTLRFDYGPWDGGAGERDDVETALRWARDGHDRVGLFGYSFGAAHALEVAADQPALAAVSALAPGARAADALEAIDCPLQVVYGVRDDTVDWRPVVDRARKLADEGRAVDVVELSADHHFVGQDGTVADVLGEFLADHLGE